MYAKGEGTERNPALALAAYQDAESRGVVRAMREVGKCFREGIGTTKDDLRAFRSFFNASKEKDAESAFTLAAMFGDGTAPTGFSEEWRLYYLREASRNGSEEAAEIL